LGEFQRNSRIAEYDYQSGSKQPHSKGSAILKPTHSSENRSNEENRPSVEIEVCPNPNRTGAADRGHAINFKERLWFAENCRWASFVIRERKWVSGSMMNDLGARDILLGFRKKDFI
jgi:hypothetical protein